MTHGAEDLELALRFCSVTCQSPTEFDRLSLLSDIQIHTFTYTPNSAFPALPLVHASLACSLLTIQCLTVNMGQDPDDMNQLTFDYATLINVAADTLTELHMHSQGMELSLLSNLA